MEALKFQRVTNKVPVEIADEAGTATNYELREMTARQREEYLDALQGRAKFGEDNKFIGMSRYVGMHSDLLTRCLYAQETGKLVTEKDVQEWPSQLVDELFKAAQKLNKLDGGAEAPAKNG